MTKKVRPRRVRQPAAPRRAQPRHRKSPLLRALVHDLHYPLSALLAYSHAVLRNASLRGDEQESLDRITSLNESMLRMLNDLLAIPWSDLVRLTLAVREADLADLVRNSVTMHRALAAHGSIRLAFHPRSKRILVTVDPHKIERVLNNLMSNAIKFAPSGSTVHVAVAQRANDVLISVRDEGPGIAVEERAALFDLVSRTAAGRREGERRMRLGLPIALHIVEAHRGRIWVESTPGGGATFYVSLPRRRRLRRRSRRAAPR